MDASTHHAAPAENAPSDTQPATMDHGAPTSATTTAAHAGGAGGSSATTAPTAREGQDVRLGFVDYDDDSEEKDHVGEENPEAALLGEHHRKEQHGRSVFGFFKLVSGWVYGSQQEGGGGLVAVVVGESFAL